MITELTSCQSVQSLLECLAVQENVCECAHADIHSDVNLQLLHSMPMQTACRGGSSSAGECLHDSMPAV